MRNRTSFTCLAAVAVTSAGLAVAGPAAADPAIAGTYNATTLQRVLDTQTGVGAAKASVGAGKTVTFDATAGLGEVSASSVLLSLTAVTPAAAGYIVAYGTGAAKPPTASLNFQAGNTMSNADVVTVGTSGQVTIYNGSKSAVQLLADRSGYWTGGASDGPVDGSYQAVTPSRIYDTRSTGKPIASRGSVTVPVLGKAGIPTTDVSAVVVDLATTTSPGKTANGFLTAGAEAPLGKPATSSLLFSANQASSNLVTVPVNTDGTINVYNGSVAAAGVVVDAVGYFTDGTPSADGSFVPTTSYRTYDSRNGDGPIPALGTRTVNLIDGGDGGLWKDVVLNVSSAGATSSGYLTTWDGNGPPPALSSSNFTSSTSRQSTVVVPINSDGSISVYNASFGSVGLVIDVEGFIINDLSTMTPTQVRRATASALTRAHAHAVR